MTYEFKYLMHLVSASSIGVPAVNPDSELDWERFVKLANEQDVLPLCAKALQDNAEITVPDEIRHRIYKMAQKPVLAAHIRNGQMMSLLEKMEAEGIHAVLLKGASLAKLYKNPMYRISVDTDILINPEDEQRTYVFLEQNGFQVEARWKNTHHGVCKHSKMGCLEVHTLLYDEIVEDIWFGNIDGSEFIREPHRRVNDEGNSYYVLGDTDNLIFIVLHMIKHFIMSGMSLRMMMDIALFFKTHAVTLNTERFWQTIDKLSYSKLVDNILWSMIKYCGFEKSDFEGISKVCPDDVEEILTDLELGGCMGGNDIEKRKEAWTVYNREIMLKNKTPLQYKLYMIKWQMSVLFPPKKSLQDRYPIIVRLPWLMPFVWMHRLVFKGFGRLKGGLLTSKMADEDRKISSEANARIDLFSKLDMM